MTLFLTKGLTSNFTVTKVKKFLIGNETAIQMGGVSLLHMRHNLVHCGNPKLRRLNINYASEL